MRSAVINAGWLSATMIGLFVLLVGPAYGLAGFAGVQGLTIAAIICLVPGWAVFGLLGMFDSEAAGAYAVLIGSGLRMALVLIAVLTLREVRPDWGVKEFHAWVIGCYLVSLAVETWLVLGQRNSATA